MEILLRYIEEKAKSLRASHPEFGLTPKFLDELYSVYPFSKVEYVLCHLLSAKAIDLKEYLQVRDEYIERNKYLYVFEAGPRAFGEVWAQNHVEEMVPQLERASKELDEHYIGQYDFFYKGIRVEVKASRAVKRRGTESLVMKSLSSNSKAPFEMNFQQLKPADCDVFVWVGVWRDKIRYWVFSSDELKKNTYYSEGRLKENKGTGMIWMKDSNVDTFKPYEVKGKKLLEAITEKGKSKMRRK